MAQLRVVNLTKIFGKNVVALEDINFEVNSGEFVVILGPSGSGKTTILRIIAGLEEPTKGDIYIDNKNVTKIPPKDRDVAMVFQNYALYPHMTVFDNMAFGLKMRKYPKEEIKRRVLDAAKILGIENLLERKPKELSGGQRQRVALGRAIVRNPKLFLFDEPLSNLDAKMRVRMRAELAQLHKRLNATSIYVTHDQVEAMTLGDKIILLNEGKIQQIADPLTLYHKPCNKFVAGFIGSPPMNFMEGEVFEERERIYFKNEFVNFQIPVGIFHKLRGFKEVILGIRPEDITHIEGSFKNYFTTRGTVELIEPLGNEVLVYYSINNYTLISRVPPRELPKEGETLTLYFDLDKVHFFDKIRETNLIL